VRLLRHVGEEGERLVQVVATAHALAAERGEDGVVGDGVADVRERGEEGAGLRDGRPVEAAVEEPAASARPRRKSTARNGAAGRGGFGDDEGDGGGRWAGEAEAVSSAQTRQGSRRFLMAGRQPAGAGSVEAGGRRRAAPRRSFLSPVASQQRPRCALVGLPRGKIIE